MRRRRRRAGLLLGAVLAAAATAFVASGGLLGRAVDSLTLPLRYDDIIRDQAAAKHLDPALIAAVIYAETKFDPSTSAAGAVGLMQILPQTAVDLARRSGAKSFTTADLSLPAVNIAYGSYYLRYLLDQYRGDETSALAAYNGGQANVDDWRRAAGAEGHPLRVGDIPFPETAAYVAKVERAQREYRAAYPDRLGGG